MIRRHMKWLPVALVAGVALTAACKDDLLDPPASEIDSLFDKYVALGNSITAGFQSGGISDSTQIQSYAAILAGQMGVSEFNMPLMSRPGCPPPYINVFTQDRGGYADDDCFLRVAPIPENLHNVAVPGAAVVDALTNLSASSDPNALTTFFLGGQTQLEAAAAIRPTFVSVWLGNNDVLGAILDANAGDPSLVTPPTEFAASYAAVMDSIDAMGSVQGGVLIGVVQAAFAPYLSQGRAYAAAAASLPPGALTVLANCLTDFFVIPGTTDTLWVSVPFHYGAPIFGAAAAGLPQTLDCSVPAVVSSSEMANMVGAVDAYNTAIAAEAAARGWAFLDPNSLLEDLLQDPTAIRPFPAFNPLDPQHETAPFGSAVSRDGIHPSAVTHEGVVEALIAVINATYGTAIPEP